MPSTHVVTTWGEGVVLYRRLHSRLYHRAGTRCNLEGIIRMFGEHLPKTPMPLREITQETVETYIQSMLARGSSPANVNRHVRQIKSIFTWLIRRKMVADNPCSWIRPLKVLRTRKPMPSDSEILKLLFYLAKQEDLFYSDLVRLAMNTGLRLGELIYLHTGDIDLQARMLHVRNRPENPLKDNEERSIPLNSVAMQIVSRWKRWALERKWLWWEEKAPAGTDSMSKNLKRRSRKAGVPHITWYSLRHYFGTNAARVMPERALMAVMGHGSSAVTNYYVHRELLKIPTPPAI